MAKMAEKLKKLFKTLAIEVFKFESRPEHAKYPESVQECIDDDMKFKPEVYKVLDKFRQSQPWRGTRGEMQYKLRVLNEDLAGVYGIPQPQLVFVEKFPVGACCFPTSKPAVIMMEPETDGRYSVVCFLHEFGHALGKNEKETCRWSINLFKRIFPKSFDNLEHKGHLLVRKVVK